MYLVRSTGKTLFSSRLTRAGQFERIYTISQKSPTIKQRYKISIFFVVFVLFHFIAKTWVLITISIDDLNSFTLMQASTCVDVFVFSIVILQFLIVTSENYTKTIIRRRSDYCWIITSPSANNFKLRIFLVKIMKINLKTIFPAFSPAVTYLTHVFFKHELHYLNVPSIGALTVYDLFDCTFECLQVPLCVSVNLAVNKGADGKRICELLSSDKYRDSNEYKGNESSHHFSIKVSSSLFREFDYCRKILRDFKFGKRMFHFLLKI